MGGLTMHWRRDVGPLLRRDVLLCCLVVLHWPLGSSFGLGISFRKLFFGRFSSLKMLLFWRKRRQRRQLDKNRNGINWPESTHDTMKTIILFAVLHIYIVVCALAFQKVEYVESKTTMPNLKAIAANISITFNVSGNYSMNLIKEIISASKMDTKIGMHDSWKEFAKAFWFVTILFTTVGEY